MESLSDDVLRKILCSVIYTPQSFSRLATVCKMFARQINDIIENIRMNFRDINSNTFSTFISCVFEPSLTIKIKEQHGFYFHQEIDEEKFLPEGFYYDNNRGNYGFADLFGMSDLLAYINPWKVRDVMRVVKIRQKTLLIHIEFVFSDGKSYLMTFRDYMTSRKITRLKTMFVDCNLDGFARFGLLRKILPAESMLNELFRD